MTKIQLHEVAVGEGERVQVTLTCISEMRGAYPDIPLPEDIDRAALGDDAFFVTLPIGQAGARSRNQRHYSRAAVEQMVAQINQQRIEGMWGHLKEEDAPTRYDPPAIRWLAAAMDADGIAWGKGLPLTEQTREYYRLAKATNARVGTSLVAWAQMDGSEVTGLELVTVDLADPARVGVPVTAAKPVISKEMEEGRTEVRGLRTEEKDSTQRREDAKAQREERGAGLRPAPTVSAELVSLREMLGEGDVIEQVQALITDNTRLLEERSALIDAAITAAVERSVRVPAAAALVEELVRARQPRTQDEIAASVAEVVERDSVRALLREALAQAMGPAQRRPVGRDGESGGYFEFSK